MLVMKLFRACRKLCIVSIYLLEFRAIGAIVFAHKVFVKTVHMFATQHVS